MLKKLIKHEWLASWKLIGIMNLFILLITLVGSVSFASRLWYGGSKVTLAVACLIFYYLTIFAVSIGSTVYIAYRFYTNLYADEGYLMHTLPVTPHQLILSKLIVSTFYMLVTTLLIMVSILVLTYSGYCSLDAATAAEVYSEITGEIAELMAFTQFPLPVFAFIMVISSVIGNVYAVLLIYGAFSLGQLFTKHKLMASILCYVGLYMVMQTVMGFACAPLIVVGAVSQRNYSALFIGIMVLSIVLSAALSVVFYFLTHYIMKRKLNLD